MSVTTYFHAVNAGDIIATMAGLRNQHVKFGDKAIIYQKIDHYASYFPGATHPTRNKNGTMVCMNDEIFELLRPLVIAQPYMEDFIKYEGQPYTVDLHRCHNGLFVNMPKGLIQKWTWYARPDLALGKGLANAWVTVPVDDAINEHSGVEDRKIEDCIIINFTQRYRNYQINYFFLKQNQERLIFAGTEEEHELFCERFKLYMPRLIVKDFLHLAQVINQAVGFLGNSSMCWNIAEAMKVPRILEYCADVPCCFAITKDDDFGVEFLYEGEAQFFIQEMLNQFGGNQQKIFYACPVCQTENRTTGTKKNVPYYHCKNCQTLYCKPIAQDNMVGGLHEDETEIRATQNNERIDRFITMGLKDGAALLDYGCGKNYLVERAKERGLQAVGFDPYSKDYDIELTGPFKVISMIEVVEHLSWPFNEFDTIHDLLHDNGTLYIETSFSNWIDIGHDYCDPEKGHCTIFSHKALQMLLAEKGFFFKGSINQNTLLFYKSINENN